MSHTPESSHGGVPQPWHAPTLPVAPLGHDAWPATAEANESGGFKVTPRLILRALSRYWWQICLIWIALSGGLVYLAYTKVKPAYDVPGYLQIDPPATRIFAAGGGEGTPFTVELETHALQVTNPDVLGPALKDPLVTVLPRIQAALDPIADLRKEIKVAILPRTHVLSVEMRSQSLPEAVAIINAIGESYIVWAKDRAKLETDGQIKRLERAEETLKAQLKEKQEEFKGLGDNDTPVPTKVDAEGKADPTKPTSVSTVTLEEYKTLLKSVRETEMELMEARLKLERHKADRPAALRDLESGLADAIAADPEIIALQASYDRAQRMVSRAGGRARQDSGDPVTIEANRELDRIRTAYSKLKAAKTPKILERLRRGLPVDREIAVAQERIVALENHKQTLAAEVKRLRVEQKIEQKEANKDAIKRMFAEQELKQIDEMRTTVKRNLEQVKFDTTQAESRIQFLKAVPSAATKVDRRPMMMAAAPVLVLALVMALFILVEMLAERVADPNDLPGRSRLGVIGVVPPLPTPRSSHALPWRNDAQRTQREIQAFVQSLDHLRVALCSGRRAGAGHRCVLITSACGGEGKTTLAAQLAGRCANAGLTTLLIDADLRRPSLGTLLEVPEGPGLADVLAGEVEPEATLVVIGNAGGFHLLPAGSIVHDPSRLLQGERLGRLLARFREAFDIVIIDTPPVLAVPDALQLGRHADGAILAVRHDSSKHSLVERARDRLESVGIPILGAVVNGARTVDNGYGYHSYAAPAAQSADDPAA